MGFIFSDSSDACNLPLEIYWTDLGREYLIGKKSNRKKGISVKYFTLGDSDCNYIISEEPNNMLPPNFVPDAAGDVTNCLKGTKDNILKSNVYLLPQHLIKTKQYTITLTDNTNNSTASCQINDLIYKIYLNGSNIFINDLIYSVYTGGGRIFLTEQDAQTYVDNNIIANINSLYINNVSFTVGINKNTNGTFSLFNPMFIIITDAFTDLVADNSTSICSNSLKTNISFSTAVISDPNAGTPAIDDYSVNTKISGCDSVVVDCSAYYNIYAFSSTPLTNIWDCIVSNFSGWVG